MNSPSLRVLPPLSIVVCSAMLQSALAADPDVVVSFAERFQPVAAAAAARSTDFADGGVSAFGLKAAAGLAPRATDVVLLFDTSASQLGHFRRRGLDAVAGLLDAARAGDRFSLAAIDVDCTPLAGEFGPARGPEMTRGLKALEARTPLGSTDLVRGLQKAAELFGTGDRPRAIVYVGDGPGVEGVDPKEFADALATLRARRIAVTSVGIGPQVDWPLLAALAHGTGGMLVIPAEDAETGTATETAPRREANVAGARAGGFAVQTVTWPEDVALAAAGQARPRMLPTTLPPLRADRESIVIVEGSPRDATLEFSVDADGGRRAVRLSLPTPAAKDDNAFLAELARNGRETGGIFLPLVGREGLELSRAAIIGEAATLAALSRQAEAAGSHASALRLAQASLRRDPDNRAADLVRTVAQRGAEAVTPPPRPPDSNHPPPRTAISRRWRRCAVFGRSNSRGRPPSGSAMPGSSPPPIRNGPAPISRRSRTGSGSTPTSMHRPAARSSPLWRRGFARRR